LKEVGNVGLDWADVVCWQQESEVGKRERDEAEVWSRKGGRKAKISQKRPINQREESAQVDKREICREWPREARKGGFSFRAGRSLVTLLLLVSQLCQNQSIKSDWSIFCHPVE
jgi:hypothetical protein